MNCSQDQQLLNDGKLVTDLLRKGRSIISSPQYLQVDNQLFVVRGLDGGKFFLDLRFGGCWLLTINHYQLPSPILNHLSTINSTFGGKKSG